MPAPSEEKNSSVLPKGRLEAFSDAVFAISMTLLILELRVPTIADHSTFGQYAAVMVPLLPEFVSFLLSFVMIAIHWVSHHYFFYHIRHTTLEMIWLNNLLLLWICLLPFPTAMLGDHPTDQFPILLYGVDSLFAALTFFGIRSYASQKKLFTVNDESAKALGPSHSVPAITLYVLSILCVYINVYVSLACFLLVPLLYFLPNFIRSNTIFSIAED
ncbi:MAG: hypothetical protein JWM56_947 [Candidatus Peribacteria bacterium]|nr:hypothetical protein [Candidatus Peribacteria bacterium]